ncbi:hypothetical protein J5N97_007668 [Dioscorea zingiberensis]|uniref:DUF7722 domain-containing protein n=1 Tax=Dioscorea zingiberensis TaxID=325984 RepID=A0A9D5HVS6_9LILI|nr:hypothetical protein J5N97_007668 [Dioscorea zingiberensis]
MEEHEDDILAQLPVCGFLIWKLCQVPSPPRMTTEWIRSYSERTTSNCYEGIAMETVTNISRQEQGHIGVYCGKKCGGFQMPLHYPRYTKADYETMPEWKLDCLLYQYGLQFSGSLAEKRSFAMGAFIW